MHLLIDTSRGIDMASINNLKRLIQIEKTICILFFPVAKYERAGDIEVFKIFGFSVYERAGSFKRYLSCNKLVSTN